MLSTRKPARYVKELTVRENVKSIKRRKQYFEKLLNYFTDGHDRDDFMEEVAFAFAFSSSPISILQVVINRKLLSDTNSVEKVGEWYRQRRTQLEFGCEVSSSLIFQSLLALNTLSILSALAADSSIEKSMILPFLLSVFADIDLQNKEGMANHNRLRHMLQRIRGADSICSFLSEESNLSNAEILKALMRMEDSLEIYLGIFDKIAESVYDNCFDGESLDLSRVTTTDYFTIDKLTGLIGKLPGNIAANMRWGWRGVSTGELARTHIFAEIFAFLKKSGCDNNIIVIDEADLYLHPEWQRTFLYDLLQHLDSVRVYENTSNPQIVICTHSPIIVSDFLPENIISLGKDEYGQTEVTKSFGFGNAIGDIYMNGMHLKSTFGEHAKKILDGIIARGRQGSLSDEDCHLIAKIPSSHVRNFLLSHD
ncbi:hypothetical protein BOW65_11745 [Pseudomonas koreensis]|nr:hypothetical protein BOW65_11745 [Pseudomonas koreensis]